MFGKTSKTTNQTTIPPEVLAQYQAATSRASQVSNTPFKYYNGEFVAGINPQQQQGISGINAAANQAQPTYQQALGGVRSAYAGAQPYNMGATAYALGAGQNVDPSQINGAAINQFMSPYLQNVAGSEAALLNQNQQQAMAGQLGNAITSGAFGGDRAGIAAANLNQQNQLANANIYSNILNQGYNQALNAAQQQQGVYLGAEQANRAAYGNAAQLLQGIGQQGYAQGMGAAQETAALGQGAQEAALQGAQAQIGAGTLEQQTQQAQDAALYNQFQQAQAYPFQASQFYTNAVEGIGALSGQTQTTTTPGGLFAARGGAIKREGHAHGGATSQGGVVGLSETREPFAYGGVQSTASGVSPVDFNTILQAQQSSLESNAPYAHATFYGSKGNMPYGGAQGLIPQSGNAIPHMLTPNNQNMPKPKSAADQFKSMNDLAEGLNKDYKKGQEIYNSAKNSYNSYQAGRDIKNFQGNIGEIDPGTAAPAQNVLDYGGMPDAPASSGGVSAARELPNAIFAARGGVAGYSDGGSPGDDNGIPEEKSQAKLPTMTPAAPPTDQNAKDLAAVAQIAALFAARGGAMNRKGHAYGGVPGTNPAMAPHMGLAAPHPMMMQSEQPMMQGAGKAEVGGPMHPEIRAALEGLRRAEGGRIHKAVAGTVDRDDWDGGKPAPDMLSSDTQQDKPLDWWDVPSMHQLMHPIDTIQQGLAAKQNQNPPPARPETPNEMGVRQDREEALPGLNPKPSPPKVPAAVPTRPETIHETMVRQDREDEAKFYPKPGLSPKPSPVQPPAAPPPAETYTTPSFVGPPSPGLAGEGPPVPESKQPVAQNPAANTTGLAPPAPQSEVTSTAPSMVDKLTANPRDASATQNQEEPHRGIISRLFKDEKGNWDSSKVIPFATGLTAAINAPTQHFGNALAYGVNAGVQSYLPTQMKQAEIATQQGQNRSIDIENAIRANNISADAIDTNKGLVRLAQGNWVPYGQWMDMGQPATWGTSESTAAMNRLAAGKVINAPAQKTVQPTAYQPTNINGRPLVSPEARAEMELDAKNFMRGPGAMGTASLARNKLDSDNFENSISAKAGAGKRHGSNLTTLASAISGIDDKSFLHSGPFSDIRATALNYYNDLVKMGGHPELVADQSDITNHTIADKISTALRFNLASDSQQHSLQSLMEAGTGVPGSNLDRHTALSMLSSLMLEKQKDLDEEDYVRDARNYSSPYSFNARSADRQFRKRDGSDDHYFPDKDKLTAALEDNNFLKGVLNGTFSKQEIQAWERNHGARGITRYILGR